MLTELSLPNLLILYLYILYTEFMPVMPRLIVIPDEDHKVSLYSTVGLRHQTASAPANSRKVVELQTMKGTSPFTSFFKPPSLYFPFYHLRTFYKDLIFISIFAHKMIIKTIQCVHSADSVTNLAYYQVIQGGISIK